MSLSFYFLLKQTGYNWDLAKEVYLSLTDLQVNWLNACYRKEREEIEKYSKPVDYSKDKNMERKTFNLRQSRSKVGGRK